MTFYFFFYFITVLGHNNWTFYLQIGLISLICLGFLIILILYVNKRKRSKTSSSSSSNRNDLQSKYYDDPGKTTIQLEPDLTQSVLSANYDYPHHEYSHSTNESSYKGSSRGGGGGGKRFPSIPSIVANPIAEHYYDMPQLPKT